MSFKTTYILFGILVILLAAFGLSQLFGPKPGEADYVLADLRAAKVGAEDLDGVEIERKRPTEEKIAFARDAAHKRWKMVQPYAARADSDAVSQMIRNVIAARKEEKADVTPNLEKFGLKPPAEVIILRKGDREWRLNVGNESSGGPANAVVYVTSSSKAKTPVAVRRTDLEGIFKAPRDFRSKELLGQPGDLNAVERVQAIQLHENKHPAVALEKGGGDRWRFDKPPYGDADYEGDTSGGEAKGVTGVRELINALDNIRVESADDFVAEHVTDLAKYGLEKDRPGLLSVEIRRKEAEGEAGKGQETATAVLLIGKKADDKGDKYYARLEDETDVVRVPAKSVEPVQKIAEDPAVLRDRDLVHAAAGRTDAVDIRNAAGAVTLRRPLATWKLYQDGKPRDADETGVQDLLNALTARHLVKSFPDPAREAELGFDRPQAVVSLWVEGLQKEEKKEDKDKKDAGKKAETGPPKLKDATPTVKLTFGKKENGLVYVRRERGKDKALVAVADSLLGKVDQGPLAYLDKNLPSFSENADVKEVVLERDGKTFEIQREAKDGKAAVWKFARPKELAGKAADSAAVERILAELRGLRPNRLVNEHPTPAALEEYGLKSPAIRATVRVENKADKKTEDWVYLFGKETADKRKRYARQGKHDLVFQVRPSALGALGAELADPTVFHFDPAKVHDVKLTGWKQAVSFTFTLEMERRPERGWAVKTPADFDLDPAQADAFVGSLANLRALRFVRFQGGPKAEEKLAPAERSLQVEVTLEGEKTPLSLTVGGLDAKEGGYYAQSSSLSGAVFLVPKDRFEKVLTGPKHFSKKAETVR